MALKGHPESPIPTTRELLANFSFICKQLHHQMIKRLASEGTGILDQLIVNVWVGKLFNFSEPLFPPVKMETSFSSYG